MATGLLRWVGRLSLVTLVVWPAAPSAAAAQPGQSHDVVVIARDMRRWRGFLIIDPGDATRCKITRSTGDPANDAAGCAAMQQCFDAERPTILAARQAPPADRRRKLADARRELDGCFRAVSFRFANLPAVESPDAAPSDPARNR